MSDITHLTNLVKSLIEEVKSLRIENQQLHEEVKCIREDLKTKKRVTTKNTDAPKIQCSAIAASSGNRCKCRAKDGKDVCEKHDRPLSQPTSVSQAGPSAPKKKPRTKSDAKKKQVPMHNHPIGETPPDGVMCELCERHGDIFDPNVTEVDFEIVPENGLSIEERLRRMLENEGE